MNADEMEAGRELDALVAEKVMGWSGPVIISNYPWQQYPPGEQKQVALVPHYSTDMAAVWEVEEKIEQRGLNLGYTQALMAVLLFEGFTPEHDEELWWALIHASSYQRCCAALKVVQK